MVEAAAAAAAVRLMKKLLKSADLGLVKRMAAGARLSEQSTVVLGDDGRRKMDWAGCSAARSSHGLISGTRRLSDMAGVCNKRIDEFRRFLKRATNPAS